MSRAGIDMSSAAPAPLRRPRNVTKCLVERVRAPDGRNAVRKSPRGSVWTRWITRWLLRRETRFLAELQHLDCVPRVIAAGSGQLVVEYVPGRSLSESRDTGISREQARRVRDAVERLHRTGVGHGALGRRDILLAADGRVVLLDFATAVGPGSPPLIGRWLVRWVQRHDRRRLRRTLAGLRHRRERLSRRDG